MNSTSPPASITAWLMALCLSLWILPAHAQPADKAAAEALFDQARQLVEAGRFDEACPKFEASQQLDPGLGTLLHLADCYERVGRLASAWATFEEAAAFAEARSETERVEIARVRAAALEPQLIRLMLEVPEERPPGFEVKRNGVPVPEGSYGVAVPVDAGQWLIRATAPGFEPFEITITLDESLSAPYQLRILPLTPLQPNPPPPAPLATSPAPVVSGFDADGTDLATPKDDSQRTLGLIIASAGVIAGGVSGLFTVMAQNSNSNSEDHCVENRCSPTGVSERDKALKQAAVATGAAIVAIVGVGVGATLFFTAEDEPSPNGAMLSYGGTW